MMPCARDGMHCLCKFRVNRSRFPSPRALWTRRRVSSALVYAPPVALSLTRQICLTTRP